MTVHSPAISPLPSEAAANLVREHTDDPEWLDEFSVALNRRRQTRALARIMEVWDLSRSEVGRRFGVSRQAVAKWLVDGIPAERAAVIADVSAATDILVRYIKRDRIPAVVRRPVPSAAGVTLLSMLGEDRSREILTVCREMFDFARSQR